MSKHNDDINYDDFVERARKLGAVKDGEIVNWDLLEKAYLGFCDSCNENAATHELHAYPNAYLLCASCFDEAWKGD